MYVREKQVRHTSDVPVFCMTGRIPGFADNE